MVEFSMLTLWSKPIQVIKNLCVPQSELTQVWMQSLHIPIAHKSQILMTLSGIYDQWKRVMSFNCNSWGIVSHFLPSLYSPSMNNTDDTDMEIVPLFWYDHRGRIQFYFDGERGLLTHRPESIFYLLIRKDHFSDVVHFIITVAAMVQWLVATIAHILYCQ